MILDLGMSLQARYKDEIPVFLILNMHENKNEKKRARAKRVKTLKPVFDCYH